jgi:hypothetical protein
VKFSWRLAGDDLDGWIADVSPLLGDADPQFVAALMDYYVDLLKRPAPKTASLCDAPASH